MTSLILVRHGETVWHGENRYAGATDVALTPRGLAQADQLASWAALAGLSAIWSSPQSRALRTATACATASHVDLQIDHRLRELDFGEGEGLTSAEMRARFPEALAAFDIDPVAHHLPGGEDPVAAAGRFVDCLRAISDDHPEDRILVVAHKTVIRLALCDLIGVPLRRYRRLFPNLGNCTLTEVRVTEGQVALIMFNAPIH